MVGDEHGHGAGPGDGAKDVAGHGAGPGIGSKAGLGIEIDVTKKDDGNKNVFAISLNVQP